jgi:hypothetical protein
MDGMHPQDPQSRRAEMYVVVGIATRAASGHFFIWLESAGGFPVVHYSRL